MDANTITLLKRKTLQIRIDILNLVYEEKAGYAGAFIIGVSSGGLVCWGN